MIQLILADDHQMLRAGLQALVNPEPDLEVVGEASNGPELLALLRIITADIIVLDNHMPLLSGEETVRQVLLLYPQQRILVLSMTDRPDIVQRLLDAGALGYISKESGKETLLHAIRTVAQGLPFVDAGTNPAPLLPVLANIGHPTVAPPALLSKRELIVLRLMAEGLTTQQIADQLFNSKRTIETHRQNLLEKTQSKNTAVLIRYAITRKLV